MPSKYVCSSCEVEIPADKDATVFIAPSTVLHEHMKICPKADDGTARLRVINSS